MNAFTAEMLDLLEAACDELESNPAVRVVIVSSATDKAFSAGADISVGGKLGPLGKWSLWARAGHRGMDRVAGMRVPTIAAIRGVAYGGGLELALACDLRIASELARLALPEVTIGTTPAWDGTARLPALIGAARAKQMIYSGQPVDAQKALAWGLVNEVVPGGELAARALELATQIAGNAPIAVQAAKQLIDAGLGHRTAASIESLASGFAAGTEDMKEGAAAFGEKRRPRYTGR
ncbi:MAG: enoyl-CoA hydratase/isomerase family protein [Proteobacteria bacterium]|nr:enoyl-CoA hydratase/isomerase family protein [Pseudomonadota bacterium]